MNERTWYVLHINPRPWAVGPLSVGRKAGGGVYPKMGRNQELHTYKEALVHTLLEEYPYLREYEKDKNRSLYGGAEVEMEFHFWHKLETAEVDGRKITDKAADLTNMVKATEDAVQGLLFNNDIQVRKQTNIIHQQDTVVPEGLVVICIQLFRAPTTDELPPHVWERIDEIVRNANGEYGAESAGFSLF